MASEAIDKWRRAVTALLLGSLQLAGAQATTLAAPPNPRVVEVSPAYLNVIQELFRLAKPAPRESRFRELEAMCNCTLVGIFQESPHRTTYIFQKGTVPNLAVTSWWYDKDGAEIHFGPEAFNDWVEDIPASTGLAVAIAPSDSAAPTVHLEHNAAQ
jgi:hypothetical protein